MTTLKSIESRRIIRAVILGISAAICYSIMTLLVKLVADSTTQSMTVFFRFTVSLLWVLSALTYKHVQGKQVTIKTKHIGLHVLRAVSSFISVFALFYALRHAPLANVNSLALTYTLFIPVLAFIFFGTKTNTKNWLALSVGFVGIIFILKPYGTHFNPQILSALAAGVSTAVAFLTIHLLAKYDSPHTILLYSFPLIIAFSGIAMIFDWKTPDLTTILYLLVIGITGISYQEFLTRAMSTAHPKIVAPVLYFSVVFSGFFDWVFWHHIPDIYFWIGMALVTSGCIFSIRYTEN